MEGIVKLKQNKKNDIIKDKNHLENIAKNVRKDIIKMLENGGHFGGTLSCVEILTSIYFNRLKKEDKLILSKAHASAALYSILSKKGIIDKKLLLTYGKKGSCLGIHAEFNLVPGVEFSCGSLGHGLSFATGMALAKKLRKEDGIIYVIIGDGESQEGSVWEAAMFASHHKLDNLVTIIDYNKIQSMGRIEDIINLEPFGDKWKAFGWNVIDVDGHDFGDLLNKFYDVSTEDNKPTVIIAHTFKGRGLSFLENQSNCHYYRLNEEECKLVAEELS